MSDTIEVAKCKVCNGTDVEYQVWKDANSGEITSEEYDDEDTWCNDCQEHNGIKYVKEPKPE